jgi:hypothetical protein
MKAYLRINGKNVTPEQLKEIQELIKDIPGAKIIIHEKEHQKKVIPYSH